MNISNSLYPSGAAFDLSNGYVYVTNLNNVSVINGVTDKVISTIDVGSEPIEAAFDSSNGHSYSVRKKRTA
ncbi:MAG: YncE family protein [Thermoplasmataceae archaeon]